MMVASHKRWGLVMRNIQIVLAAALVSVPLSNVYAKQSTSVNRPESVETYASIGDILVKVTLRESLPNAFGKADIFGRKRDRGFVEIRFMGMTDDGRAVFRRRTVDIYSNETTMSRSGVRYGSGTVYGSGNTAHISTMSTGAAPATIEALPPDTFEFALDLSKNNTITIEDRIVHIISADPGGVKFMVRKQ
jgi:hypothetical protein